jgi:hypothetical protein
MNVRHMSGAITAGLLACGAITFAVERGLAQEASVLQKGPVTVVGCLQQGGKHNKYLLANATSNVVASVPDAACTTTGTEMIRLEGTHKLHLDESVGRWVEISGKLEGPRKRPELRVKSFRQVPVVITRTVETTRTIEAPPAAVAPEPVTPIPPAPEEKPAATTGTLPKKLPHTASPLPLIGLTGLMSLAGGLGLRLFRRREDE